MSSLLSFVSDNGTTYPLDGTDGITAINLIDGLTTIPQDLIIDPRVGDGGALVNSRLSPRHLTLDFMILPDASDSHDDAPLTVLERWAGLQRALFAGGTLLFDGANGPRELRQVKLESASRTVVDPAGDDVFSTSLIALDPWWYGEDEFASGTFGTPTAWDAVDVAWDATLPWDGGSSTTIINTGDAPAWCTVVVQGAIDTAAFSIDGVAGFTIIDTVLTTQFLSVSGEPGNRGPHHGAAELIGGAADGPIDWTLLTESSQLFDIPVGSSSLVFGATGTDGNSLWWVFWSPRYLTP